MQQLRRVCPICSCLFKPLDSHLKVGARSSTTNSQLCFAREVNCSFLGLLYLCQYIGNLSSFQSDFSWIGFQTFCDAFFCRYLTCWWMLVWLRELQTSNYQKRLEKNSTLPVLVSISIPFSSSGAEKNQCLNYILHIKYPEHSSKLLHCMRPSFVVCKRLVLVQSGSCLLWLIDRYFGLCRVC